MPISHRFFGLSVLGSLTFYDFSYGMAPAGAGARPNAIFFLVDDMGWMDSSVYGSTFYQTPSMERLAKSSVRFINAYSASPLCSPSRASIMSGQYPARHGITSAWGHMALVPNEPDYDLEKVPETAAMLLPYSRKVLAKEQYTMAEAFRDAGYRTGFIGKWHLGVAPEYWPEKQGFDFTFHGAPDAGPPSYFSPYKFKAGTVADGPEGEYLTDRATAEALKFIRQTDDRPFFLCLWHWAVHTPFQAKKELIEFYSEHPDPQGKQLSPTMAAMIQSMDESLGRLLDELERSGRDKNTVIVFTSDNGGVSFKNAPGETVPVTCNAPLRSGKGTLFEGGSRVPALIRWPGVTDKGSVSDTVITGVDYYPTLLEICGIARNPDQIMDGVSLVPALKGGALNREAVYCFFPHNFGERSPAGAWIRQGDWKLIEAFWTSEYFAEPYELYNLKDDIGETRNLARRYPERTAAMAALLKKHYADCCTRPPVPNPAFNPEKLPVGGWCVAAGSGTLTMDNGVLKIQASGISTKGVPGVTGKLKVSWKMRTAKPAAGRCFWSSAGSRKFAPENSLAYHYSAAGNWQECAVTIEPEEKLFGLRIDFGPRDEPVEVDSIELSREDGTPLAQWSFNATDAVQSY